MIHQIKRYKKDEIEAMFEKVSFDNDKIDEFCISIIGHFGNCISLGAWGYSCCEIFSGYNNTENAGYIIQELVDLLTEIEDNSRDAIKTLIGCPVRLIVVDSKCVGIGNFMRNEFVLIKDLLGIRGV